MWIKRTALIAALPAVLLSACGASSAANGGSAHSATTTIASAHRATTSTSLTSTVARRSSAVANASEATQRRLAVLVARAKAIYANELSGTEPRFDLHLLASDQALLNDLARGNQAAAQVEAKNQMVSHRSDHITRVSVIRGSHVLVNAVWNTNGSFVVEPVRQQLYLHGRNLGTLLVSVQDVVGYVKLIHDTTGAQAVVRGSSGQVRSSLPSAAHASLPQSGLRTITGHRYAISSFTLSGWRPETLTVWILTPA